MENKWIIIFTFLAIIILILSYFNIYRYIRIHYDSDDKYIKKYKKIKKHQMDCRIIISLTTIPERIKHIKPVLKSLLDQTIKVDQIVLNIPKICKGDTYDIPEELNKMCNIFTCGRDYGPGTKFIPTILRENNADTIIIMLDDDYIYGENFIKTLLEEYKKDPLNALCLNEGMLIKPEFIDPKILYTNKKYINNEWIKKYILPKIKNIKYNNNLRSFLI